MTAAATGTTPLPRPISRSTCSSANPDRFSGDLTLWTLGDVSLSRLTSEALQYRRLPQHFKAERDEHFLVTVPARSEVFFSQCGKDVRCNPGGFILERSHEPYEFSHAEAADLWVMKVEAKALGGRIRQPDRFCSLQFNAADGAGGLFTDMLHLIPNRFDAMSPETRATVGPAADRSSGAGAQGRRAHADHRQLHRARGASDAHRGLRPPQHGRPASSTPRRSRAAAASPRATCTSCSATPTRRSAAGSATAAEGRARPARPVEPRGGEIAYRWGFSDQAQFSRAFRRHRHAARRAPAPWRRG